MTSWNRGQEVPRTQVGASYSGCPLGLLTHVQSLNAFPLVHPESMTENTPSLLIQDNQKSGVVVHDCNPSTLGSEAGGWV